MERFQCREFGLDAVPVVRLIRVGQSSAGIQFTIDNQP
jgi:hypothetical protein